MYCAWGQIVQVFKIMMSKAKQRHARKVWELDNPELLKVFEPNTYITRRIYNVISVTGHRSGSML